MVARIVLLTLC